MNRYDLEVEDIEVSNLEQPSLDEGKHNEIIVFRSLRLIEKSSCFTWIHF